jgi:hypothetical protein
MGYRRAVVPKRDFPALFLVEISGFEAWQTLAKTPKKSVQSIG